MKRSLIAKLTVLCLTSQWHYHQSLVFMRYIFLRLQLIGDALRQSSPEEVRDEFAGGAGNGALNMLMQRVCVGSVAALHARVCDTLRGNQPRLGPNKLAHVHSTLPGSTSASRAPSQRQQHRGGKLRPVRSWRKRRACWSAYIQLDVGSHAAAGKCE
jgi:hypothetical protein